MIFDKESDFEEAVIELLIESGWEPEVLRYPTEQDLIDNWATILFNNNSQRDRLNDCPLTDGEMHQIMEQIINLRSPLKLNGFINGKSVSIKRDNPDDKEHFGQEISLKIYDRREIAHGESRYQIVQQPQFTTKSPVLGDRRGDLLLLINGMPVIHMELKRSGIPVSQAYNQIEKYMHEGVFAGIFSLVQVFVAMEPEEAVYFANPGQDGEFNKSYYFHWADFDNEPINDWKGVVSQLLNIPMAHMLIGFYTIADDSDGILKVMRSYQYYAANRIADRVTNKDWGDTDQLGGHIWHTTGSGKTMTSFKSAQLIASSHDADKVIFLVDRKELGTQSLKEYRAFASENEHVQATEDTEVLISKLRSDDYANTLIVTSIQKLSNIYDEAEMVKTAELNKILSKRIVIIIDEAHRSTFGDMLATIKDTFKHSLIFGFTGTPIQEINSRKDSTTATIFGNELHRYTLGDGIRDKNVLGFDPYMVMTYDDRDLREKVALMKAKAATVQEALGDEKKKKAFYKYMDASQVKMVGEQKGQKYISGIEDLVPNSQYETEEHRKAVIEDIGRNWLVLSRDYKFHAIFATSSIPQAVKCYRLMKNMLPDIAITAMFDPTIDNEGGGSLEKEDGIVEILEDYKLRYSQQFTIPTYDQFRKDVSARLAHKKPYNRITRTQQIDILIVVKQMLTGFDSKWINTLYLDKVMEYEDLIQAFSRTNRLFGDDKPFGTIKYYRKSHTMERNISEAVKAYSGDIPTGLFVDKLQKNLNSLNREYAEIAEIFSLAGITDFEKLPGDNASKKKFAKSFKQLNLFLEAALIQGFVWNKSSYEFEAEGIVTVVDVLLDHETYLTLAARYKELSSGGGGGRDEDIPFDIDTHLTEINTDIIDADYMNSRFQKFLKLIQAGGYDQETWDKSLQALHKSFAMLSQEEQRYANVFIHDVQAGNIVVDGSKTFRDYIAEYMKKAENVSIQRVVRRLGCYAEKLRELLRHKVTEDNINEYGRFDDLKSTVDKGKAKSFFVLVETLNYRQSRLNMYIDRYLRYFILTGGKDPYPYTDDKVRQGTSLSPEKPVDPQVDITIEITEGDEQKERIITSTVKSAKLRKWHSSSKALACMMETGAFAYIDDNVCLCSEKYVETDDAGKMYFTQYAKENEEECFLRFQEDEDGNLRYVLLPKSIADTAVEYNEEISEEIMAKFRLVNEIANRMLDAIGKMKFGAALKELMSERICHCSTDLLKSITGLDKKTVSLMWGGKSLTNVNVISACLGIHIPYPVSERLLKLAKLSLSLDLSDDADMTYHQLLTLRWASDYGDIYDDLEADGMETLIKKPPL